MKKCIISQTFIFFLSKIVKTKAVNTIPAAATTKTKLTSPVGGVGPTEEVGSDVDAVEPGV